MKESSSRRSSFCEPNATDRVDRAADRPAGLVVNEQLQVLREAFRTGDKSSAATRAPAHASGGLLETIKSMARNSTVVKSVLAALAVIILGIVPLSRLLTVTSAEAIVKRHVTTVRAPISGLVAADIPNHTK